MRTYKTKTKNGKRITLKKGGYKFPNIFNIFRKRNKDKEEQSEKELKKIDNAFDINNNSPVVNELTPKKDSKSPIKFGELKQTPKTQEKIILDELDKTEKNIRKENATPHNKIKKELEELKEKLKKVEKKSRDMLHYFEHKQAIIDKFEKIIHSISKGEEPEKLYELTEEDAKIIKNNYYLRNFKHKLDTFEIYQNKIHAYPKKKKEIETFDKETEKIMDVGLSPKTISPNKSTKSLSEDDEGTPETPLSVIRVGGKMKK